MYVQTSFELNPERLKCQIRVILNSTYNVTELCQNDNQKLFLVTFLHFLNVHEKTNKCSNPSMY
jgi:hypothetical protein